MTPKYITLKTTIAAALMATPLAASAVNFKDSSHIHTRIGGAGISMFHYCSTRIISMRERNGAVLFQDNIIFT